ncbi:uncharacterized protein LOC129584065 isoform X2 [Paramacrobiotus metropolitanus]|uniref:uncharacterized protein LOC129584065 isoform X2 n=1 Tax=Paramacrobiotus metropolitanus TaxID=2943436 RepID=UPI00244606A8|nr:uncharacterized protein LOC129584065 isoform X2 [Paramacrobiotus metropolitanus]
MMLAQQLRKFLIAAPAWMPEVMQRSMSSTVCGPSEEIIKSLKTVLTDRAPVTYGTCVIPPKDFGLFYGTASGCTARHISLLNTQAEQVELLARACHAAHFGLNKRDGYEAAFHMAEKLTLDVDHFAAKFDVERCGILARVKNDLLGRHNIAKSVECELYKLNVFRKGDSWRTYNGTPGSAKMFGSLVIVFPIPHTGGKFILRHGGKEWSFETGRSWPPLHVRQSATLLSAMTSNTLWALSCRDTASR